MKLKEELIQAVNAGELTAWVFDSMGGRQSLRPEAHERIIRKGERVDIIYEVPS